MKQSTCASIFFLALLSTFILDDAVSDGPAEVENWFNTLSREKPAEKMTKLHYYIHLAPVRNITSSIVARSNVSSTTSFGIFYFSDEPVTSGPGLTSERVGYLTGMYASTSFEELGLFMAHAFVFTDGIYNGSSISVSGYNPPGHRYREVPVVGGSGLFRMARGVATLQTFSSNLNGGIIEVDLVVFH